MYDKILLAAALQRWDQYSAYALAARDVATGLARGARQLHVLSVYEYQPSRLPAGGLSADLVAKVREQEIEQTDLLMKHKIEEFVAPLLQQGLPVSTMLRTGSARHVVVEVATEIEADLLIIGSHSKRGLLDIALGDTARHIGSHAPCPVVMVSPKK